MITMVTTSTITTVAVALGFSTTLGLITVAALIAVLCAREIAAVSADGTKANLSRSLDMSIAPIMVAFVVIVTIKVNEVLA
ncbi:hypothetical protein ACFLW3_00610 [Chloroflexota bacterium]